MSEPYVAAPVGHVVASRPTISAVVEMDDFPCRGGPNGKNVHGFRQPSISDLSRSDHGPSIHRLRVPPA